MPVRSLQDIEESLLATRESFRETSNEVRYLLADSFALYFDFMELVKSWTTSNDEEVYVIEIVATVVRRVVASLVLLESGLPQEAHMVLRNALELVLVAIDVIHNSCSLETWKASAHDDVSIANGTEWYFKPSKTKRRITENADGVYPAVERQLASNIYDEWRRVSDISVHAHSYAQITVLCNGSGGFQLFGLKQARDYAKDFMAYGVFLFNTVSILMGIPRYRQALDDLPADDAPGTSFRERYARIHKRYASQQTLYLEVASKAELQAAVLSIGYPFDISSIPDEATFDHVVFDFSDPTDPKMIIEYQLPSSREPRTESG